MSKSNAIARRPKVEVIAKGWTVNDKTVTFTKEFREKVFAMAGSVGAILRSFEDRQVELTTFALNLNEAFVAYKKATNGGGLPAFVHETIDPTCPDSYGKVGTPARDKIVRHPIFRGVEALIKRANAQLKIEATKQKLITAGVDPADTEKVADFNKEVRDSKRDQDSANFTKCIEDFARHGVTEKTVSNFVILVLRKKEKGKLEITKAGQDLVDAAMKNLWTKGLSPKPTPVEPQPSQLMETLKQAVKDGDNAAAGKAAKNKK